MCSLITLKEESKILAKISTDSEDFLFKFCGESKLSAQGLNLREYYLKSFWWPLTSTATGQLILNRKCYQVFKTEMELHMINIIYAALPMREQTEKTTLSCKDD